MMMHVVLLGLIALTIIAAFLARRPKVAATKEQLAGPEPEPEIPLGDRVRALGDDGRVPISWLAYPYRRALADIRDSMRMKP